MSWYWQMVCYKRRGRRDAKDTEKNTKKLCVKYPVILKTLMLCTRSHCIASKLNRVGWNKRSGSTKRERDLFKVRSVIDVDSPFAGERCCIKSFFLLCQAIDFLLQGIFLSVVVSTEAICGSLLSISGGTAALVPPYSRRLT